MYLPETHLYHVHPLITTESQNLPFPQHCENNKKTDLEGEACIGVLGIQDISHFTSRDIGYYLFYFQEYGILCTIFGLLSGILII